MPQQSKCNGLALTDVPNELADLNPLEIRLISRRIPFMKLIALPRGKQQGIHGPAVNVPTDLDVVCDIFPRLPDQCQIIPLKLKRKIEYKKAYMKDYVRPQVILMALQWLKEHNPLYSDVKINKHWSRDFEMNDPELWRALTVSETNPISINLPKQKEHASNSIQADNVLEATPRILPEQPEQSFTGDSYLDAFAKLKDMAKNKGFTVFNVDGDGNCLFNAACHELKKHNLYDKSANDLRCELSRFMQRNPECGIDGSEYKDFVSARVEQDNAMNADTAQPDERDRAIARLGDPLTEKEMRWILYLDRLEHEKQWGDHIIIKALCERFQVNVNIIATEFPDMPANCPMSGDASKDINLGLILQYHYVALDKKKTFMIENTMCSETNDRISTCMQESVTDDVQDNDSNNDDEEEEELRAEEEAALDRIAETCGLPYETALLSKDPDWSNKELSCAPGEKHKPLNMMTDVNYEELSNPEKFPDGKNGLQAEREKHIHPRRYFNQRLLDVDGRFAKSPEYLLSAQYATESAQIYGNINHYVFRRVKARESQGGKITAGQVKDMESLRQLVRTDQAYKLFKNVRGSPAYFQSLFYDILAMMSQLGVPTWFFTLSAADMQWPDLIQTIAKQYGKNLTDDDVKNLSYEERCTWLRKNPVTAVRHFQYRLETFVKHVLQSTAKPLGEVVDYAIRIEFQARGSPHAHTLLWVKNAPQIDVQSDEEVSNFVKNHISCELPTDDQASELVLKLQKHSHSSYCRKKGKCRFNFPKPPSEKVIIAKEPDEDNAIETKKKALKIMQSVYDVLTDKTRENDISTDELLALARISSNDYYDALSVAVRGRKIILPRTPSESCINPYNRTCLMAWQANMDLQFVEDPHACIMYIAAYISKDEKGMGELLKQVSKECRELDIQTKLRKLGSVFLNNREVSSQEAAMRILSMPMKRLSRSVVFINTDPLPNRTAILKPKKVLETMDDDDEDVFQSNVVSRYALRPTSLESVCLAKFASNYAVTKNEKVDDMLDDAPQVLNDDDIDTPDEELPKKISLRDGSGVMHKRNRQAVIRFRKFNPEKETEDFCRAKLMLFLPWRQEERDLLKDFPSYASHYASISDEIAEVQSQFIANLELTNNAIELNEQFGPPEHVWGMIAPENTHNEMRDHNEGVEVERPMAQEDLDANAALFTESVSDGNTELMSRYDIETNKSLLPASEYRQMLRSLNKKQKQIIMYNRKWCKKAVRAWRNNQSVPPYRIFMSGPGGVGKSHVIKLIQSDVRKILPLSNRVRPTDVLVLKTAPTGVAAFNIDGMTVHSALLLRNTSTGNDGAPLTFEKLNTIRSRLENLTLMIIDEVSMVGSDMLLNIHRRLNEIKGIQGNDVWFGNVSILAVGDLYQLPPVKQSCIFKPARDSMARLQGSGSIFMDEFFMHELTEIMRQKDDTAYAELLCRIRNGTQNENDIEKLKSREIDENSQRYPKDALHVFAFNKDVNEHNTKKLAEIASPDEQTIILATDDKTDSTGIIDISKLPPSRSRTDTGGLETVLKLAIGARVMMTVNVDTSDGLVNGVMGTVKAIIKNQSDLVVTILVEFDEKKVGEKIKRANPYRNNYPNAVPVSRYKGQYQKQNKKGAQISRMQFPLTLAWAVTIHKCQGLTLNEIVVSMKGGAKLNNGQAYVAFSRVKNFESLHILQFNESGIKTDKKINEVMNEMRNKRLPVINQLSFAEKGYPDYLTIGHLNIHYFLEKQCDLLSEFEIYRHADIMCFTETYLMKKYNISKYLTKFKYTSYRLDIPDNQTCHNKHGIMICVSKMFESKPIADIQVPGLEFCAVTVEDKYVVCAIYSKPSTPKKVLCDQLKDLLDAIPKQYHIIITGDFNYNLFEKDHSQLLSCMKEFGFNQYVSEPTTDSGSLLDHMYYNKMHNGITVEVVDTYFSDHDSVFMTIPI